jgi:hypothetical protein
VGDEFKFHLDSWSKICTPISSGALGVRNLILFNRALLETWLWLYNTGGNASWRLVVEVKYESMWEGWCSNAVYRFYGVGVWINIRRGWEGFSRFVRYEVGDELKTWF